VASSPGTVAALSDRTTFAWKDRAACIRARQAFLCPGGESGARQSLFWFADAELLEPGALNGTLLGGAERSGPASLAYFKSFAAVGKDPLFSPGSFTLLKPDVENLARNTGANLLFGNYQWLRGMQRAGGRDFRALVYALPHGYAMPISLLSGRVTGSGGSAAKAQDFLLWLLSPENQKALSGATGYMAANFNAANLDLNSLGARETVIGAARIVPIDPEPAKGSAAEAWNSLLGRILARPADWERVLAEREKR
jgi:ABC-type glycerol-3-phosphate transport system substrate-binding protein